MVLQNIVKFMKQENSSETRRLIIKEWMSSIKHSQNQLTSEDIAQYICLAIQEESRLCLKENDDSPSKSHNQIQLLWKNNEYFNHSLIDLCEDLLYYVYAVDKRSRKNIPRCLIGYYEIVKNILYLYEPKSDAAYIPIKSETPLFQIPPEIKQYLTEKTLELLFSRISMHQLLHQLTKFYDSNLIKLFKKELQTLLQNRIREFQKLYGLQFMEQGEILMRMCLFTEGEIRNQEKVGDVTLDEILLCLVYLVFRIHNQMVILGKIVDSYQDRFEIKINRIKILQYFNDVFLITFFDPIKGTIKQKVGMQREKSSKFRGGQIKEQRSLFDMFEE